MAKGDTEPFRLKWRDGAYYVLTHLLEERDSLREAFEQEACKVTKAKGLLEYVIRNTVKDIPLELKEIWLTSAEIDLIKRYVDEPN